MMSNQCIYDSCPFCRESFSFAKPVDNVCQWCRKALPQPPETTSAGYNVSMVHMVPADIERAIGVIREVILGEDGVAYTPISDALDELDVLACVARHSVIRTAQTASLVLEVGEELQAVLDLQEEYNTAWRDRPESYWLMRVMQEVGELASVLANDHDDTAEHELRQIASICLNWLYMRRGTSLEGNAKTSSAAREETRVSVRVREAITRPLYDVEISE